MNPSEGSLEVEESVTSSETSTSAVEPNQTIFLLIYCLLAIMLVAGAGIVLYTVAAVLGA